MSFNIAAAKLSQEDFDFILKNGKRSSILLGHDFKTLLDSSYGFLKFELIDYIKSFDFEGMVLGMFKDRKKLKFHYDLKIIPYHDYLYFICWIKDELQIISNLERDYLSNKDIDIDLSKAGIDALNKFGDLNVLDTLASGDITKYEAIKKMPYSLIFDKQYKTLTENEIQKRYQAAIAARSKLKNS